MIPWPNFSAFAEVKTKTMENKKESQQGNTGNAPNADQNKTGNKESENNKQNGGLVSQDEPLKNNDRDIDPENPQRSSLEHR